MAHRNKSLDIPIVYHVGLALLTVLTKSIAESMYSYIDFTSKDLDTGLELFLDFSLFLFIYLMYYSIYIFLKLR